MPESDLQECCSATVSEPLRYFLAAEITDLKNNAFVFGLLRVYHTKETKLNVEPFEMITWPEDQTLIYFQVFRSY